MKMAEITSLSATDVNNKVEEIRKELFEMRIEKATSGIEKSHIKTEKKKTIARLLTHKNKLKGSEA